MESIIIFTNDSYLNFARDNPTEYAFASCDKQLSSAAQISLLRPPRLIHRLAIHDILHPQGIKNKIEIRSEI